MVEYRSLLLVHPLYLLDLSSGVEIARVNFGKGGIHLSAFGAHPRVTNGKPATTQKKKQHAHDIRAARDLLFELVFGQKTQFIGSAHGTSLWLN
jgi:hypothetical protein